METIQAVSALAALAHETRLQAFRKLVMAGPSGLPAGELASALEVAPATLSFHLKELSRAGLVGARRSGRQIYYAVDFAGTRGLFDFLMQDCCRGRPELCGPLARREDGCLATLELENTGD